MITKHVTSTANNSDGFQMTATTELVDLAFTPNSDSEFNSEVLFGLGDFILVDDNVCRVKSVNRNDLTEHTFGISFDSNEVLGLETIENKFLVAENIILTPDSNGNCSIVTDGSKYDSIQSFGIILDPVKNYDETIVLNDADYFISLEVFDVNDTVVINENIIAVITNKTPDSEDRGIVYTYTTDAGNVSSMSSLYKLNSPYISIGESFEVKTLKANEIETSDITVKIKKDLESALNTLTMVVNDSVKYVCEYVVFNTFATVNFSVTNISNLTVTNINKIEEI